MVFEEPHVEESASLPSYLVMQDNFISVREAAYAENPEPVTMLGDAVHLIPSVAGLEASFAFQDTTDLCYTLVKISSGHGTETQPLENLWERTNQGMRYYSLATIPGPSACLFSMWPIQELRSVSISGCSVIEILLSIEEVAHECWSKCLLKILLMQFTTAKPPRALKVAMTRQHIFTLACHGFSHTTSGNAALFPIFLYSFTSARAPAGTHPPSSGLSRPPRPPRPPDRSST